MKIGAIIQARVGSSRLPNKVMMDLFGKSVLNHVITRLKQSNLLDEIIIATTTTVSDNIIINEAISLGVKSFRGSELNVLERYYIIVHTKHLHIALLLDWISFYQNL